MQYVILLLVIGILLCVLTGNAGVLFYVGAGILLLLSAFLVVLFLYSLLLLLRAKRVDAVFTRVGPRDEEDLHKVAYYNIDGTEYPCLFPEEGIFRKKLYRTDRTYRVRFHKQRGCVFDRSLRDYHHRRRPLRRPDYRGNHFAYASFVSAGYINKKAAVTAGSGGRC